MLINEQKYANKNRLYYRGLADNDKSAKFYKETYLTTRLIYALAYSFGLKGIVEVYRLKDTANIFNNTTCEVYAFVEATAISGPACVYIQ